MHGIPSPAKSASEVPDDASSSAKAPARLRIVHLEDDDLDAAVVLRELQRAGIACDVIRVGTGAAYEQALAAAPPDLILSNNRIRGYDGLAALYEARDRAPGVPFVFVSGTIREEVAIEAMREGATDYVFKDRLSRLGPVIERIRGDLDLRRELGAIRAQYLRGKQLEAMGKVAGTVAHDFRNILAAMLGHTELLGSGLSPTDPAQSRIRTILDAGRRGVDLCAQLLTFGRQEQTTPVDFSPLEEARQAEALFRSLLPANVSLAIVPEGDPGLVHADRGQFGQVMMNLLVNARDAVPHGGAITLSMRRRTLTEAETFVASVATPGEYVAISIEDTGTGMPEDVRLKAFEPYFSTKAPEKGTGLGLSIVYGIVRNAGGHLHVSSTPGKGSTFCILLPRVEPRERDSVAVARATILVADDDAIFREQIGQALELAGFMVMLTGDGVEAMEAAARHAGPIALLLVDLHMPRMDGWELSERFARLRPETRILVMTGGAESGDGSQIPTMFPILRKPFRPHDLLARVNAILSPPG